MPGEEEKTETILLEQVDRVGEAERRADPAGGNAPAERPLRERVGPGSPDEEGPGRFQRPVSPQNDTRNPMLTVQPLTFTSTPSKVGSAQWYLPSKFSAIRGLSQASRPIDP